MKKSFKRLAIMLSIVMLVGLFAPYGVVAETNDDSEDLTTVNAGTIVDDGDDIDEDGDDLDEDGDDIDEDGDDLDEEGGDLDEEGEGLDEEGGDLDEEGGDLDEEGGDLDEEGGDLDEEGEGLDEEGDSLDKEGDEGPEAGMQVMMGTMAAGKTLTVNIEPADAGTVSPSGGNYPNGTNVSIQATPSAHYLFDRWSGDGIKSSGLFGIGVNYKNNPLTLKMDQNRTITAYFVKKKYTVKAVSEDTNKGTVSPASKQFDALTTITFSEHFTPNPKDGYEFDKWLLDGESATSAEITGDITIRATFKELSYNLAASVNNPAWGSVSPETGTYDKGSTATVTATATDGYKFIRWEYDQEKYNSNRNSVYSVSGNKITIKMEGKIKAKTVKAIFEPATYSLDASVNTALNGDAMGKITLSGGEFSSGTFNNGVNVTLRAVPSSEGYEFVRWEYTQENYDVTKNVYSKDDNKVTVTMRGDNPTKSVRAIFKQVKYSVDAYVGTKDANGITVLAPHMGEVDPARSEWSMWYDRLLEWENTRIVATANQGYQFVGWEYIPETFDYWLWPFTQTYNVYRENGNKLTVIMKGNIKAKQVIALFKPISYNANATVSPEGSGSITGTGAYDFGAQVTLTATPAGNYEFKQWTGSLPAGVTSTDSTITFTMPAGDVSLVAEFEEIPTPTTGTISVSKNVVGEQLLYAVSVDVGGSLYEEIDDDTEFTVTLYDSEGNPVDSKTISEDQDAVFTDLPFGTYYLEESFVTGYNRIDDTTNNTEIILDEDNNSVEWLVVNQREAEEPAILGVEIAKTVNKPNAYAGDTVTYAITVTNTGDTPLCDVVIYDELVDKSWVLYNPLYSSESFTITYDYTIPADKQVNDVITNTATVYANEYFEDYPEAYRILAADTESEEYWEAEGNMAEIEYDSEFDITDTDSVDVTVIARPSNQSSSSVSSSSVAIYTLRTAIEGEGTITPGPGSRDYFEGYTVQLSAVPAEGWKFDGWTGDAVNENNQIVMNGNKSVTAVFSPIEEEIEEEPAPQAPVTETQEEEVIEEETPAAPIEELPKTGGVPAGVFYGLGGLIAAAGAFLKKRVKK